MPYRRDKGTNDILRRGGTVIYPLLRVGGEIPGPVWGHEGEAPSPSAGEYTQVEIDFRDRVVKIPVSKLTFAEFAGIYRSISRHMEGW